MKLSDIFSLNLNSKGGAKLFKKIANKYNLDYKQVRKSVEENVGGGSSKIKYYNCIDGNAMAIAERLGAADHIAYMNVYSYDDNGNAIDTYIVSYKMLKQEGLRFAVRHIAFLPTSIVIEGGIRLTINSFEELLSMLGSSAYIELFKEITEEEFYKID